MSEIKEFFPIFSENPGVIYLDTAASSQKPNSVIEIMDDFYKKSYSNIHRGVYNLSLKATEIFDETRKKVKDFIGAKKTSEIIFTKGTTDSINLLASCFSHFLRKDDEIIISEMEHHSNLLPWKNLENTIGIKIKYLPVVESGELDYEWFENNISDKVKLVCLTGQSNVLGVKTDIKKITDISHKYDAKVFIDGAQYTVHFKVDVSYLDVDFFAFSAHKIYGPTGIGILYGKKELLDKMPPYQFGGDMVENVSFDEVKYKETPYKFEAGTPNIVGVVGFNAAIDFMNSIGMDVIEKEAKELTNYAFEKLQKIDGIKFISGKNSNSIISFVIDGISSFDIGMILGAKNICIRVGKHCAEPLHDKFGVNGSIRISTGVYNDKSDIDKFVQELEKAIGLLR